MFGEAVIKIDVHGMRTEEALKAVTAKVEEAPKTCYKVQVIHGFNGGTRIRSALREEFSYGRQPKVKRVAMGDNEGVTDLILRELY